MIDYEPKVKDWFSKHGYEINKIPESSKESPDFLIVDETSTYVLELKTKFPSGKEMDERRQILSSGEIHKIDEIITRQKGLSKIISKAKNQIKNHGQNEGVLRLLWLLSTGHLAKLRLEQFETILYGSTHIQTTESYGNCYFFYNGDFFKYRDMLDAAIVSTTKGKLLLNPLSPRYTQMKNSSLINHFEKNSVIDPIEIEKQGNGFLVDGNVNRSDEQAVIQYLKEKYKTDKISIDTTHYISETRDCRIIAEKKMTSKKLSQAVQLIKLGNKAVALSILKEIVRVEPNNENAWLWLHTCVKQAEQKRYCLQRALKINPNNQQTRNALLKIENDVSISSQPTHIVMKPSQHHVFKSQSGKSIPNQHTKQERKKGRNIFPLLTIISLTLCLFFMLITVIVKSPIVFQIPPLIAGESYSSSMKLVLNELQAWNDGPIKQHQLDMVSLYGPEFDGLTNSDVLILHETLISVSGLSTSEATLSKQEIRKKLSINLLPALNAIKQDGFVIATKLEGMNPPDSIKSAHKRVTSCVNHKIEVANALIVFLETGNTLDEPSGDCNFFEESLQSISDFINRP